VVPATAKKSCDRGDVELIDTEQRARRLARTVAMDIVLYNEKQIGAGADLSREIAEGRSHFCARVTPSLHWIFEDVLATTPLGKPAPKLEQPIEAPRIEAPLAKPSSRPPPAAGSSPLPSPAQAIFDALPLVEPEPPRAISSAPPPEPALPLIEPEAPVEPEPLFEPEPPRATSSAPPPERAEPEIEPAPPESDPVPEAMPVAPAITRPGVVEPARSGSGLVIVLLGALAVALAVSWFVLR
jgi:hypothetical protein